MYKYCPHCSHNLSKPHKSDSMQYCNGCKTEIYHYTPQVSACVLLNGHGQILLVKRKNDPFKGLWSLPAGYVKYGENPIDAGLRELEEETGLKAKYDHVVGIYIADDHPKTFSVITVIKVKNIEGKPRPLDDAAEVKYFNPKKLPKMAFKAQVKAIEEYLDSPAV